MLSKEENDFIGYWERNRLRQKKVGRQFLVGIPLGLLIVIPTVISFTSGWYKRVDKEVTNGEANPKVLEPIMKVVTTAPTEFQGNVVALLQKRNAVINDTETGVDDFTVWADVSLNGMFGFSGTIRAATQGKGEFSMEFSHYAEALPMLQKELISKYLKEQAARNKK